MARRPVYDRDFYKVHGVTVIDGDTVRATFYENEGPFDDDQFAWELEEQPTDDVRLCAIAAPERQNHRRGTRAEPYSRRAKDALQELVGNGDGLTVYVTRRRDDTRCRVEGVLFREEVKERYVAHAQRLRQERRHLKDQHELDEYFRESINYQMCLKGWATYDWAYGPASWGFGDAERTARANRSGMWGNERLLARRMESLRSRGEIS